MVNACLMEEFTILFGNTIKKMKISGKLYDLRLDFMFIQIKRNGFFKYAKYANCANHYYVVNLETRFKKRPGS